MRGRRDSVDFSIYARGFSVLARNPVIIVFPLLAALFGLALELLRGPLFDPLGGNDFGILGAIAGLAFGFAFALSIIAAETAWRGRKPTLSATWDEGKRKAGSILMAIIGFIFIYQVAAMLGGYIAPIVGILLQLVALFFIIYTIPAAAIGGIPGGAALSASIERVRGNYAGAAVLTIVAILLYIYLVAYAGVYLTYPLGAYAAYGILVLKAIVVGYLAVVFARQYDDVGFFRPY